MVLGTSSMQKSISLLGGIPEISWNTPLNSLTIGICVIVGSVLAFSIAARRLVRIASLAGLHWKSKGGFLGIENRIVMFT